MNWLNPKAWLGLIGIVAVAYAMGYFTHYRQAKGQTAAAAHEQYKADVSQVNAAVEKLEAKKDDREIVYKTITKTVDRIIDRPVYRNVCFDADGMRAVNDALESRNSKKPN